MTIRSEQLDKDTMVLFLSGRLDTVSSSKCELELNKILIKGTFNIIFDLKELDYISSSGLHVLLQTQKMMAVNNRKLVIRNIGGVVKDVFDMTGFSTIFTFEE